MNKSVHIWIQRATTTPGVLACGIRCTDRSIVASSVDERFPIPRVQSAMREMLDAVSLLQQNRLGTDRLRWKFEHGRIHCTVKADGTMAAVLVNTDVEILPDVESLLSDFHNMEA